MSAEAVDWTWPLAILAGGLVLGALFVWLARRRKQPALAADAPALELRDLGGRRDALVAQLRELDATRAKLSAEEADRQRAGLELELALALRAIDEQGKTSPEKRPGAEGPARATGVNPTFKGFLWGFGSASALFGLFLGVARVAEPRKEGGSVTGEIPTAGGAPPMASSAAAPQPLSAEEQALQTRVSQNPDDLDARIGLAQAALSRNDMMAVWNQTQYILQREPGEPHALAYQALVRVAMGQPEMAVPMLKQALQKQPDFVDAYLHLALAYLRLGRAKDADQIVATAQKRFPSDADAITQFYAQMRARVKQAPSRGALDKDVAEALPGGPDNPHAGVDAAPPGSAAVAGHRVAGTVELDPALRDQLPAGGVLFVFARATGVSGGPPAAAKRLVPAGFPLRFELTDADSMMGQPLPGTLRLEARLDTDGDPRTQDPKDPKGVLDNVAVGTSGLKLVLTR